MQASPDNIINKKSKYDYPSTLNVQNFDGYQGQFYQSGSLSGDGFSSKYDQDDKFIAFGCFNGHKILHSVKDNQVILDVQCPDQTPITCVKWRPMNNTKSKVLGITNSDGLFQYWHAPSLKKLFTIEQNQNSIHCCDFSQTGENFATAGKDCHIRIYDESTKSIITDFGCAQWNYRGHSNRIFAVKFIDNNTIISGGWDSVIHVWDMREGKSVKSFYGPHVAGDSIDLQDNSLLIGCYAMKDQIQIWDIKKFQVRQSITWSNQKDQAYYVYSSSFSHFQKGTIVAGSCGTNEIKVWHQTNGRHQLGIRIHGLKNGVFSVDTAWHRKNLLFTTAQQAFYIYKYGK